MKQILFSLSFLLLTAASFAQGDRYQKTMEENIARMDTSRNPEVLTGLAHTFERVAAAEKTQWLPYYYAALSHVMMGYNSMNGQMGGEAAGKLDGIADKAQELIVQAEALSKDNSEIFVVKKMVATLRMMVDPMNRYMQYGPEAQQALETAKKLNPDNPRIYLLEGQDKFYTPEQFGGSKAEAKKLFDLALQKYETFKPRSKIDPSWGKGMTRYFAAQIK